MAAASLIALIASVVSATLGVLAIVLAVVFYRMSADLLDNARKAAGGVAASIDRLEKLFDTLYSDSLAHLKEAYAQWRQLAPAQAPSGSALESDRQLQTLKHEILREMSALLARQKASDAGLDSVCAEMAEAIDRAIAQARHSES